MWFMGCGWGRGWDGKRMSAAMQLQGQHVLVWVVPEEGLNIQTVLEMGGAYWNVGLPALHLCTRCGLFPATSPWGLTDVFRLILVPTQTPLYLLHSITDGPVSVKIAFPQNPWTELIYIICYCIIFEWAKQRGEKRKRWALNPGLHHQRLTATPNLLRARAAFSVDEAALFLTFILLRLISKPDQTRDYPFVTGALLRAKI